MRIASSVRPSGFCHIDVVQLSGGEHQVGTEAPPSLPWYGPPLPGTRVWPAPQPASTCPILQGQRTLSCFAHKRLHQEVDAPTG
jgi:hypothetical protein